MAEGPTTFTLKKLGERVTYAEILRYLDSVQRVIFQFDSLPPDEPPTQIFVPTLEYPQTGARDWSFVSRPRQSETDEQRYLFIGDIFKLIDEIQAKIIADGNELIKRNPESETAKRVAEIVGAEKDFFTQVNLYATRERIANSNEEYLAHYRADHRREIQERLDRFAQIADEVRRELGEDLEIVDEVTAELEPDVGEGVKKEEIATAVVATTEPETEQRGDEGAQTDEQQPPEQPRQFRQDAVAQDFENIRTLSLESERLTNAYLARFAAEYGIPLDMLQGEFKNVVRRNFQSNITRQLGLGQVNELYANTVLRKEFLDQIHISLNLDAEFAVNLNHIVEARYKALRAAREYAELEKLHKRLDTAKTSDDFTRFKENLLNDSELAVSPIFRSGNDPQAELIAYCRTLPYFDPGRLNLDVDAITEKIDALIYMDESTVFLDKVSREQFNLIFNTSLSTDQFNEFKSVLSSYWSLRKQEYISGGVRLGRLTPEEQAARTDALPNLSPEEFKKKHVQPLNRIVATAQQAGGHTKDNVIAVGSGKGEEPKVSRLSAQDNIYIKKLKADIYNQELWRTLTKQEQIAIYDFYYGNQYSEGEILQFLQTSHVPEKFCLADVGEARITMTQHGIHEGYYNWDEYDSPFIGVDTGMGPLESLRRRLATRKTVAEKTAQIKAGQKASKAAVNQAAKTVGKTATKQATKKAAESLNSATNKMIAKADAAVLGAASTALGLPGLGAMVAALPPKAQEFIGELTKFGVVGAIAGAGVAVLATAYITTISIGAKIGSIIGGVAGPIGSFMGTWLGYGAERGLAGGFSNVGNFFSNLFGGGNATPTTTNATAYGSSIAKPLAYNPNPLATTVPTSTIYTQAPAAGGVGGAGSFSTAATQPLSTSILTKTQVIATQAVGYSVAGVAIGTAFSNLIFTSALLADFPPNLTSVSNPDEKLSNYATIMKTVDTGCPDNKCPEITSGKKTVTYTIVITPTGNGTCITITGINDILKTTYSKKKYEELGRSLPSKPDREKHLGDFPELSEDPNDPKNTACIGETITISYEEEFDSSYNHASIRNTFEANFYWKDASGDGTDNVMTGKSFCIGDCSMEAGCWPTTGIVSQAPFSSTTSHAKMDAFDIANNPGTPIYAPFAGEVCEAHVDSGYGNHALLTSTEGTFLFGHMTEMYVSGGCKQMEAGEMIGLMGSTGNSTGPHLHFEKAMNGGFFRGSPPSDIHPDDPTQAIMPPSNEGISPIKPADEYRANVTSCYDTGR